MVRGLILLFTNLARAPGCDGTEAEIQRSELHEVLLHGHSAHKGKWTVRRLGKKLSISDCHTPHIHIRVYLEGIFAARCGKPDTCRAGERHSTGNKTCKHGQLRKDGCRCDAVGPEGYIPG